MAAPGKNMFSNPTTDARQVNPNYTPPPVPPELLSSRSSAATTQATTPQPINQVKSSTKGHISKGKEDYLSKGAPQRAKKAAEQAFGEKGIMNDLPDDFWNGLGQYVVDGDIDLEKTQTANQIGALVNSLKGRECVGKKIDDDFTKGLFDRLTKSGFDLNLKELFRCLIAELQNAGATVVNAMVHSNQQIVKDTSLNNLESALEVGGEGTKVAVPNYREPLGGYQSQGNPQQDYGTINNTMTRTDPEWDSRGGKKNVGVYKGMSNDARAAFIQHGDDEQRLGASLGAMF